MIKHKFLIAALLLAAALVPSAATAGRINIEIGDRGFYHGATYWDGDWQMTWVPGRWGHGHKWVHGHYLRGENRRHHHNRDWRNDRDDRRDERRDR